jgi:hypothetical protein
MLGKTMKYSLRSLMIVVTLICMALGGVMGRVKYLRQRGQFHEREAHYWQRIGREPLLSPVEEEKAADNVTLHVLLARDYQAAASHPWTLVDEARYTRSRHVP